MRAKQPMSRAEFIEKVEVLLGKFDSDSFMHGFNSGVNRVCDVLTEWVCDVFSSSAGEATKSLLLKKIERVRKTRRN